MAEKINDNFSVEGYVAASYEYQKVSSFPSTNSFFDGRKDTPSADAAKIALITTFKPVTAVASLFYIPRLPKNELTLLDAYASIDVGGGVTLTGGKFLSYLGYEAFDASNMSQITYGAVTVGSLGAIPAYHTGGKIDYAGKEGGFGLALVDSIYASTFYRGDGEFKHNAGVEGYVKYTGTEKLTLWGGFAYDSPNNQMLSVPGNRTPKVLVLDFWAEYKVDKNMTVAAELCTKDGGTFSKGMTWLTYLNYAFSDTISTTFRISGESLSGSTAGSNFVKYTICPAYKINDHFSIRSEISLYNYSGAGSKNKTLFGIQALLKF